MELALDLSEIYFGRESGMWLSLGGFQEKGYELFFIRETILMMIKLTIYILAIVLVMVQKCIDDFFCQK